MGVTQLISDLNSFSANIADFRHLHSPEINIIDFAGFENIYAPRIA